EKNRPGPANWTRPADSVYTTCPLRLEIPVVRRARLEVLVDPLDDVLEIVPVPKRRSRCDRGERLAAEGAVAERQDVVDRLPREPSGRDVQRAKAALGDAVRRQPDVQLERELFAGETSELPVMTELFRVLDLELRRRIDVVRRQRHRTSLLRQEVRDGGRARLGNRERSTDHE